MMAILPQAARGHPDTRIEDTHVETTRRPTRLCAVRGRTAARNAQRSNQIQLTFDYADRYGARPSQHDCAAGFFGFADSASHCAVALFALVQNPAGEHLPSGGDRIGMFLTGFELEVAKAAAKAAASAISGAATRFGLRGLVPSAESKALVEPVELAIVQAIEESRRDDNVDAKDWWTKSGRRLLKPLTDRKVARPVVAASLASPDNREEAQGALLAALKERQIPHGIKKLWRNGPQQDFADLADTLGVDADQFLHLLPDYIRDQIILAASQPDSPLQRLATLATLREIAATLAENRTPTLSPKDLTEEVSKFLQAEQKWHEAALRQLPYLYRRNQAEPLSRGIPATARLYDPRTESTVMITWTAAIDKYRRLAVLADPGMGKTWLVHTQAALLAAVARTQLHSSDVTPNDLEIPIAIRCDTLAAHAPATLGHASCQALAERHTLSPGLHAWLEEHLKSRSAVYLMDALDEVPRTHRTALANMVRNWETSNAGVKSRMIVTSRMVGYHPMMNPDERCEAKLQPFSTREVKTYIRSLGLDPKATTALQKRLDDPSLAAMARIPLLLTLLCLLMIEHHQDDLPLTRTQIYGKTLRRFLRAEHHFETAVANPDDPFDGDPVEREQRLMAVLRPLAFAFAETNEGWIDQMTASGVLEEIGKRASSLPKGADSAAALKHLSVDAGVLIRAGDVRGGDNPPYLFLHRTFAEYLVAEYLSTVSATQRTQTLQDHLWFDAPWAPVWPMMGALLSSAGLSALLGYLLDQELDPVNHALITAAKVIGELDLQPTSSPLQAHIDLIADRLIALLSTPARRHTVEPLVIVLSHVSPSNRSRVHKALTGNSDTEVRSSAAEALAARPGLAAIDALLALAHDSDEKVRDKAAKALAGRPGTAAFDALLRLAQDNDGAVRAAATRALTNRPEAEVSAALLTLAQDNDGAVRAAATRALTNRPEAEVSAALLTLAQDNDGAVRAAATRALTNRPEAEVSAALLTLAQDNDTAVRASALRALANRPEPAVIGALLTLSYDASLEVRWPAAAVLAARHEQKATDALLTLVGDADSAIRESAARALQYATGPLETAALIALARDTDSSVQESASASLRARLDGEMTEALLTLTGDDDSTVRWITARALFDRPEAEVTDALLAMTRDDDSGVRWIAARALAKRPGSEVTDTLLILAGDDDSTVRGAAAQAMTRRTEPEATAALITLAADDDIEVQRHAVTALAGRTETAVTDTLLTLARHTDGELRLLAVKALGGRLEPRVTAALLSLINDTDHKVRSSAADALADRPDEGVTPALVTLVEDTNSGVRESAAQALKDRRDEPAATQALLRLAQDSDSAVRGLAGVALIIRVGPEVTQTLIELADERTIGIKMFVRPSLGGRLDSAVTERFLQLADQVATSTAQRSSPRADDLWYEIAVDVASKSRALLGPERENLLQAIGRYTQVVTQPQS
jgi:HEAT repeat protein